MKNRDEYLESIYAKRNAKIKEHKKKVSVLTSILCLAVCFVAAFAFIPKYFEKEIPVNKSESNNSDKHISADTNTSTVIPTVNEEFFASGEQYPFIQGFNNEFITDNAGNLNRNDSEIKSTKKNDATTSNNKLHTEIAIEIIEEATTMQMNFGYVGEPFDPDLLPTKPSFGGYPALAPAETPDDFGTEVTEPCLESSDSETTKEKKSTTAATLKSSEEAAVEAKNFLATLSREDSEKIIDEKTQVTITRTSNGKTTYTVYFYTKSKSFEIDVDAVSLRIIGCKQKYLVSGYETYISPPYYPETTAALPEYKPQ